MSTTTRVSKTTRRSGAPISVSRRAALLTLGAAAFALSGNAAAAAAPHRAITQARNLQRDGARARADQLVLLLLLSRSDCGYCEILKRDVIGPMIASGEYRRRVLFRELILDAAAPLVDFSGDRVTASEIAQRYREWLTPTVLLLGPDGAEAAPRRRGVATIDFYGHYLNKAIERARATLSGGAAD